MEIEIQKGHSVNAPTGKLEVFPLKGFICEERLSHGGWPAFERATARLFQHAGWRGIEIVGGSGDRGADVVGEYSGKTYVFQCKFQKHGTIPKTSVEETIRAINAYQVDEGMTVTNQRFNQSAEDHCIFMRANGVGLSLLNGTQMMFYFESCPQISMARREPRIYQTEAIDSIENARGYGSKTALVIMATGLGKSIVAYEVITKK